MTNVWWRAAILLSKVSSQDIATYPDKLQQLDGVRTVTVGKPIADRPSSVT